MSYTVVLLPILSVLSIAHNNYLQPGQMWRTVNSEQQFFTDIYWPLAHQLSKLSDKELSSIISKDINEVNKFLKDKGFDIQLEPFKNQHPKNRAFASVLDIMLKWKIKGIERTISINEQKYPAIFMPSNEHCRVKIYDNSEVASIKAENNDTVYIMKVPHDQGLLKDFTLIEYLKNIDQHLISADDYKDILFPMVDINDQEKLDWLLELSFPTSDGDFAISQALQQTKFQMNEEGAAAQSAVAIGINETTSIGSKKHKHLIIDKPFYIWIMREGVDIPLFAAYVDTQDWKKPAKLGR